MLIDFFLHLKNSKLPVSTKEYLTLLEAMQARVCEHSIDDFYFLARACLVKDETHYDRFDRAFAEYFKGIEAIPGLEADIPEEWLKLIAKRHLTQEEMDQIKKLGWEKLMEEFKKRLEEQKSRHQGGSKWIGTGGTSPFGAHGYNPEGYRVGSESGGNRTAVKVWDERQYRNLDDACQKLREMILKALKPPKVRRATRPTKASVENRINHKKQTSFKKSQRQKRDWDE